MTDRKITVDETIALAELIRACWETKALAWRDSVDQVHPSRGVARALVLESGGQEFIDETVDPRDAWLRVTTADGDRYVEVAELLPRLIDGDFLIDMDG